MNIANVTARFAVLAEIDSADTARFSPLIEEACRYVQSMCVIGQPDSGRTARLEMLSAVYALRLYGLLGEDQLTQFVAGDVRLTSSADRLQRAEQLWKELAKNSADLIRTDEFIFGRVI